MSFHATFVMNFLITATLRWSNYFFFFFLVCLFTTTRNLFTVFFFRCVARYILFFYQTLNNSCSTFGYEMKVN